MKTKLKDTREEKGYSLQKLADMAGISKSTLQRYETGTTKKVPIEAVNRLEEALGISFFETRFSAEDEHDINKSFKSILYKLSNGSALTFNGGALDEETRQLLIESLKSSIKVAKIVSTMRKV